MTEIEKLEAAKDIAFAELGLIEELRSVIAILGAIVINDYLIHSWPVSIALAVVAYLAIPYWHSKKYDAACEAVARVSGTGKYFVPKSGQT